VTRLLVYMYVYVYVCECEVIDMYVQSRHVYGICMYKYVLLQTYV